MSEQKRVNRPYVEMGGLKLTPCQFLSVMDDKPAALSLKDGGSILVWKTGDDFMSQRLSCPPIQALARWRKENLMAAGAQFTEPDCSVPVIRFERKTRADIA